MRHRPLPDVHETEHFGGKAVSLGQALRAGLPVPAGHGLSVALVDALADDQAGARALLDELLADLDPDRGHAVRSSAVDEDSAAASFAGQHATLLNVPHGPTLVDAVREVWASGRTDAALAYRSRLGLPPHARVAVVVQRMVVPDCAGVLFTRDPVTGDDQRVIEAAWGLGEAVVGGLVTPDRVVVARGGHVREHVPGHKDIAIVLDEAGHTREVELSDERAQAPCLDPSRIEALEDLARACEAYFDGPSDIEWAFEGETLHLLQRRAITR
jgi:pyruvate,water dikinase